MSDSLRREVREIVSVAEWLSWRDGIMTASRVPALFDEHPYMTRDGLVDELRGQSQGSTPAMRRGRILEPAVAAAIAEEKPRWRLRKATTFHLLPDHRLGGTPDYFADTESGLLNIQCKTVNPDTWEKWHGRPPLGYVIQTACENLLVDASAGKLAVMVTSPSYPLHLFDVPRHPEAETSILDAAAEFWRAWDCGDIASPAPANRIAEMLDDGSYRDLSGDNAIRGLLEERRALKEQSSACDSRLKVLDYEIKNRVGSASTAWLPGWSISFKRQHRKAVPATDFRVLRIKESMEEEE